MGSRHGATRRPLLSRSVPAPPARVNEALASAAITVIGILRHAAAAPRNWTAGWIPVYVSADNIVEDPLCPLARTFAWRRECGFSSPTW
jgi:hypothetical protein